MATKDLLDSDAAKNKKPAADMTNTKNKNNADQKMHMPCKNSVPT